MKQILAFLLAAVMCMSLLTACGRNKTDDRQETTPPVTDEPSPSTPSTPDEPGTDKESSESDKKDDSESIPDAMTGMMLKADATLEDIVMKLGETLGISMPTKVDDSTLKDVFGIEPEWIEEYYGEYSAANTSADHLLAFKVKEGHVEDVKKALEARREAIIQGFEESLLEQLEKARNATIVEKGNYVFFVIAGDVQNDADKEANKAQDIIDSFFE